MILTAAFTEQFQLIGWHHLFLEWFSSRWGAAMACIIKSQAMLNMKKHGMPRLLYFNGNTHAPCGHITIQ
jgi:hypothetical protein